MRTLYKIVFPYMQISVLGSLICRTLGHRIELPTGIVCGVSTLVEVGVFGTLCLFLGHGTSEAVPAENMHSFWTYF